MSKTAVIRCLLSLILAGYIVFALTVAHGMAANELCEGIDVKVNPTPGARNFVTSTEVSALLHEWGLDKVHRPIREIDTQQIEDKLATIDNIEHTVVSRTANHRLNITVTPMQPVARVFETNGHSYYINAQGKKLTANSRFRLDVPVLTGAFDSVRTPVSLLPLVQRISRDSTWNAIVSHIAVEPRTRDVILVPIIRGHVINIGSPAAINDKLARVMLMYHKVLPRKGWNYYDTISVKWAGQVVATRRHKEIPEPLIKFDEQGDASDYEDVNSMLTGAASDTSGVTP